MDIYKVFRDVLVDEELCSSEIHSGKYILRVGEFFILTRDVDISVFDDSRFKFTPDADKQLKEIYAQMNALRVGWEPQSPFKNDPALQKLLEENGLSDEFSTEDINGTINILSPLEMFDRKKFGGLHKDGIDYLPFDLHYNLAICFKVEDGIQNNLYIFNTEDPDTIIDMKIGCRQYLQLAYEAKLLYHWQYAFVKKDSLRNQFLRVILPEVFPFVELDLSNFQ